MKRRTLAAMIVGDDKRQRGTSGMMRRVRVGLTGLACVFLLVMLATALISVAQDRTIGNRAGADGNAAAPTDPLAQLGVAPGNPASENSQAAQTKR